MKFLAMRALSGCAASATFVIAGCTGGTGSTTLIGSPAAVQFERSSHSPALSAELYVPNSSGGVLVYSTGSKPTLLRTITNGVAKPGGIWVDKTGVLYAVNLPGNSYQTSLPEYESGTNAPFRTITNGIVNCAYVAVDKLGNVYVTGVETSNGSFFLEIYPKGQVSPAQTLTIPHTGAARVTGLAFDSSGSLLVGESVYLQPGVVYRLAPGSQTFTNLNLQNAPGGTIAVDKAGNLYSGSGSSAGKQSIAVYRPKSTSPYRKITVKNVLDALTVASTGELYVETTGNGQARISVYSPDGMNPMQTFDVGAAGVGLALSH